MTTPLLKLFTGSCCFIVLLTCIPGCDRTQKTASQLDRDVSYALAVKATGAWIQDHRGSNNPALLRGMTDVAGGTPPLISMDPVKMVKEGEETNAEASPSPFENWTEKKSYIQGFKSAETWKVLGVTLEPGEIQRGYQDVINQTAKLSPDQANEILAKADHKILELQNQNRRKLGDANLQSGIKFLSNNATKPGVVSLPSGLEYKVLSSGSGNHPLPEDYVTVSLHGTLIDGTPIDNFDKDPSRQCTLCLSSLIPGWTEALQLMSPGDRWQLFLPSQLAYGEEGTQRVGPNSVVIYTLELKSILPGPPTLTPEQIKEQNSQ